MSNLYHKILLLWKTVWDKYLNPFNFLFFAGNSPWIRKSVSIQLISIVFQISIDEGQELAAQWDCPFFETSAALRNFVDDTFHTLIREIRRHEREAVLGPGKKQKKYHKKKQLEGFFHKLFKKSDS